MLRDFCLFVVSLIGQVDLVALVGLGWPGDPLYVPADHGEDATSDPGPSPDLRV